MKKVLLPILGLIFLASCGKTSTTPQPPAEENIVFETNAGQNVTSPSGNFDFQVTLKSKMPAKGIRIEVSAIDEVAQTAILPQNSGITSTTAVTSASVQNLPRQKWVEATVKVTSLSTATNTASGKFRVIYK